nr:amino acid ABC transporter substrate-binding protein [uncultured Ottowia sp.]
MIIASASFSRLALRLLAGLAACAALASPAHAGPVLNRIQATGVFKMGYRPNGVPFSWETSPGAATGYAPDICQRIAAGIAAHLKLPKLQVQAVPVLESTRIPAVVNGEIDMECAGTTNNKARREQVAFGLAYFYAGSALMVREGSGITGLSDLRGKNLGVLEGATGNQIIDIHKNRSGGWTLKTFKSMREATTALERGEIDALLDDDVTLLTIAAQSGGKFSVPAQRYSIEPLAPMFSKSDPELERVVLQIMQQLYRDGEMDAIYKRWFLSPLPGLGYNLNLKMGALLQDNLRRPTAYVTDWTVM